jgi:lipopolysaccharide export system protein LptA
MKRGKRLYTHLHQGRLTIGRLVLSLMAVLLIPSSLAAQVQDKLKMDKEQPIQIQSDRLDAYQEKKTVVFSGRAVATQGDKTIKADRLIIYYKHHAGETEKKNAMDTGTTGDLEKLEAQGHVVITQTNRVVTGNQAVFYQETQKIVMTGNAVMREGKNVVKGERIVVYLDEDRGVVEGSQNKRVTATIYPNEKKKENPE